MKSACLLFLTIVMCAGCGSGRVSQDMFTYKKLTQEDQEFIASQRTRQATGGTTTLRKAPKWMYVDGVLIDTNNVEWIWTEGSPTPMQGAKTP